MMINDKKIIVTGANGFIGSALCKRLAEHGVEVYAVVEPNQDHSAKFEDYKNIHIIPCDLKDFKYLDKHISERGFDVLYHLAWIGSAGTLRGDYAIQISNILYAAETAESCKKLNCRRMVFAASIMEYEIDAVMNTEKSPGINTLYCSAKKAADYISRTVACNSGIEYIRTVISNVYGPGEKSARLINTSIRKMLEGEHCSFSEGNQMYDFIYIDDAVEAFVAIGDKGKNNNTYYIGSLKPEPLKNFLINMGKQVDPDIKLGLGELPFDGVALSYDEFDIEAVKKDTGFVPKVSFEEGIRRTVEYIRGEK